jgi:hypothetical protein
MSTTVYPHGVRVRVIGEIHGSQTVNVLHFGTNTNSVDLNDWNTRIQVLCQAVAECIITHLLPVVTSDWKFLRTEGQKISTPVLDPVIVQTSLPNQGQGASQGATIMASLVHIRTGRDGRKGRGKIFLPPGGENHLNNGEWDALWLAALTAFLGCLASKFAHNTGSSDFKIGVLSRKDFEAVGGSFQSAFRDAEQLSPAVIASSMRTRKKGRGA